MAVHQMLTLVWICLALLKITSADLEEPQAHLSCDFFDTVDITDGEEHDDGSITHNNITYQSPHFKTYNYTLTSNSKMEMVSEHIRGCICQYRACVRSCCEPGQIFSGSCRRSLLNGTNFQQVPIDKEHHDLYNHSKFAITYGHVCDNGGYILENDTEWKMRHNKEEDAIHLILDDDLTQPLTRTEYCLVILDDGTVIPKVCFPDSSIEANTDRKLHFGMALSVPFLLVTFFVYVIVPELRTTLLGKSLMCYVLSLAVAFSFLSTVLFTNHGKDKHPLVCYGMAFTIYTSLLSSFFWLCVISFDIWWTFGSGSDRKRRFRYYNFFVWSLVAIFLAIVIILEKTGSEEWSPRFGLMCWFTENNKAIMCFFFLPLLGVLIVNTFFFLMTARQILKSHRSALTLSQGDSRRICKAQSDKEKFSLFVRLFILMGATWIMELVSIFYKPQSWFWYITDLLNCLQGVIIFFLFVWKPRVRILLMKRYRTFRGKSVVAEPDFNRTLSDRQTIRRNTMRI